MIYDSDKVKLIKSIIDGFNDSIDDDYDSMKALKMIIYEIVVYGTEDENAD